MAASGRAGSGDAGSKITRAAVVELRVTFIQRNRIMGCAAIQSNKCAAASGADCGQRWQQSGNGLTADGNVHQNRPVMQGLYWPRVEWE
ncbi:hypothetical protein LBMAG37_05310 [Anaerolineae bacterium]|nr:hypothetical protein LBMAG37_05310 [Anaerolineae bacterium]